VWLSKNEAHEKPYSVTGTIKLTGSEQAPKAICKDRIKNHINFLIVSSSWN